MRVKSALMMFGGSFIIGTIAFFGVMPMMMFSPYATAIFGLISVLTAVGFFGSFGTFVYWLFVERKKVVQPVVQ